MGNLKRFGIIAVFLLVALVLVFSLPGAGADSINSTEIISMRTENSKTFNLGKSQYRAEISSVALHYKNDYQSKSEQWKDIDTTIKDGKVTAAPYELIIDGLTIMVRCKRTDSTITLTLSKIGASSVSTTKPEYIFKGNKATFADIVLDTDLEILATNESVKFTRVLKTDKAPLDAELDVKQDGDGLRLYYQAVDADNNLLKVTTSRVGNKVVEKIADSDLQFTDIAGEVKVAKYPIRIDPTVVLTPATEQCFIVNGHPMHDNNYNGSLSLSDNDGYCYYGLLKYSLASIPVGATLSSSILDCYIAGWDGTYDAAKPVYCERTTSAWSASTVTWNTAPTYTATDRATGSYLHATLGWFNVPFSILALTQDAISNRANSLEVQLRHTVIVSATSLPMCSGTKLTVTYTLLCTVVTLPASLISYTTARLNGNVTVGETADVNITFFWGDNNGNVTAGNWDFSAAPTSPAQPQGVATCYKDVDTLHFNALYYFNVRGVSSGGTSWGTSGNFTTLDILDCGLATFSGAEGVCGNTLSWSFEYSNSTIEIQATFADCEPFVLYEGNATSYIHNVPLLLDSVTYHAQVSVNGVPLDECCNITIGGEGMDAINDTFIVMLALGLALGLSFLSIKVGSYLWFVSCWPWVALATLASTTWLQGVAILMAVVCLGLFVVGISGKSRGR